MNRKNELELIQMLRGVAALLVVLFHVTINSREILQADFFSGAFFFGGAGVDIFFVLSGFIIAFTSSKLLGQPDRLPAFVRRRFVRIFPAYWLIIVALVASQFVLRSAYNHPYPLTFANAVSTLLLLPGHVMVNGVSWTLSYELFFYLLFSLAFLVPSRRAALALAWCYPLFLVTIAILGHDFDHGNTWAMFALSPINIEFVMGLTAAAIVAQVPVRWRVPLVVAGVVLFIAGGVAADLQYQLLPSAFNRVLLFGVPSFLIVTGLASYELGKSVDVHGFLLSLGEASYSLYLLHLPIVVGAIRVIARLHVGNPFVLHALLLAMIVAVCAASILFFRCIERPMTNRLNRLFDTGRRDTTLARPGKATDDFAKCAE